MKKTLLFIAIAGGLASCKTTYVPNAVNAPLFQEKNEVRLNVSGRNLQAAYAVTDHFGVVVNGFAYKEENTTTDSGFENHNNGKGGLIEFGAGYFMKLDDNFVFETYAGFGGGRISFDDQYRRNNSIQNRTYNADLTKLFLQPSIGYTSDNFDASFSLRFVTVKYNNQRSSNYSEDDLRTDLLFDLHKTQWTFIEPTMTLRGGFKYVKLYLQLGRSFKLNPEPMQNSQAILGLGLTFCYAPRFMK